MEYATLHEMKELLRNKNPSKDDAGLLKMAAAGVNFVRKYSLTKAGVGPPVPLEKGLEETKATRPAGQSQGLEWKSILSKSERENLEAMSDLAQGMVYTCLLYTSPSPRDEQSSRMPSSA